ncbi:hypothetical protein X801_08713 [Opisthorchis viverrini]|uniref:Mediator of RNA polymerase II transcription subunit 19 n=1 Tax=Opisthorchis viverrini TaxID=6198 RepID=A0A1S8WM62_OPIVI|nr:hypothetical protein X801_08713 [Opisthorchis viverrini]
MNVVPSGTAPPVPGVAPLQGGVGSSLWINKLKIVGSGHNWAVAPCEPFYLMGTEPPATDAELTGAKNLIEHYGLGNAYQKFCSKSLREELSAFLPHLSGNVDVPATVDGSGLMSLIERPPIRGKELRLFAPGQLDHAFRLHPGPLPQEYAALFAAAPPNPSSKHTHRSTQPGATEAPGTNSLSSPRTPVTAGVPPFSGLSRRRRRTEVHRGQLGSVSNGGSLSSGVPGVPQSGSFFPNSGNISTSSTATPLSTTSIQPHGVQSVSSAFPSSNPPSAEPISIKSVELPPGLIPVSNQYCPPNPPTEAHKPPPPPPPLLAPVHHSPSNALQRSGFGSSSVPDFSASGSSVIPAPPVLHSIHPTTTAAFNSITPTLQHSTHSSFPMHSQASPGSSPPSPDLHRPRRPDSIADEERRKKRRKEKKRRKDRE